MNPMYSHRYVVGGDGAVARIVHEGNGATRVTISVESFEIAWEDRGKIPDMLEDLDSWIAELAT